jgi:hypothetical protein
MTVELEDRLMVAVDALALPRLIPTTLKDDDGNWVGISTVEHPALLVQLVEGTGASSGKGSSGSGIPIDADALETAAQIGDMLKAWRATVKFTFVRDDLPASLQNWHKVFVQMIHDGHVVFLRSTDGGEHVTDSELDCVRFVESWVRQVEKKFDPDKVLEWTDPCYSCGVRRIEDGDVSRFAISVNVTQVTAECGSCGKTWAGIKELSQLRYFTNLVAEGKGLV